MGTQNGEELKETPCGLWSRLDPEHKQQIVGAYARMAGESGLDATVIEEIAGRLRFRPGMVKRARGKQASRLLLKAIAKGSDGIALSVMVDFCMIQCTDTLSALYDALGVKHKGIEVDDLASAAPLEESAIEGALILARSDNRWELALCFEVLGFQCFRPWQPVIATLILTLREQGLSLERGAAADSEAQTPAPRISTIPRPPDDDLNAGQATDVIPEDEQDTEPELQYPQLTTLDKVLIRAVIAALNNVEGALDEDKLDDLIQETLELNDSRFQSYFHRGFLDSLTDRPCQNKGPGENDKSRAWYLAGYCQGLMRRNGRPAGAEFITGLSEEDLEALFTQPVDAGVFLIPSLMRPLLDARKFSDALRWIGTYLNTAPERVIPEIVLWARRALLESDPGQVAQILELCCTTLSKISAGAEQQIQPLVNRLERRLAIALRLQGKETQAESMIDRLLAEQPDRSVRSKLLGDKLLIQMGMRSLQELRIRKVETREALVATLESVIPTLELFESTADATSPVADLATAIGVILKGSEWADALQPAIDCMNRAIQTLEKKNPQFWTENGVLPRARFYLSVLELRLLDPAAAAPAATRLIGLIEGGLKEPLDLIVDAVDHTVVQDLPEADHLARIVLRRWPQAVLKELRLTGLVRQSSSFRTQIVQALDASEGLLTAQERWRAWSEVLDGALSADERDIPVAQRALDEMEILAENHGFEEPFTELLREPAHWDPAWTPMEAETARFRLLESTGKLVDARAALVNITHGAIGDGAGDVEELVEKLQQLGAREETLGDLRARINATEPPEGHVEVEAPELSEPVSVLFIGGDERQASYVKSLTEALAESHPSCNVRFEIPGWSSNWGREFEKYFTAMEQSNAVVLMRFMRTNFGRRLRKAASETDTPWIPCTGHGHNSMLRAIHKAIHVSQRQRASRPTNGSQPPASES